MAQGEAEDEEGLSDERQGEAAERDTVAVAPTHLPATAAATTSKTINCSSITPQRHRGSTMVTVVCISIAKTLVDNLCK